MNETNELPTLYSYADLEEVFGMSHDAIYRTFVRTGRLPAVRFSAKTVRFRAEDVQRLVDEVAAGAQLPQRGGPARRLPPRA